MKRSLKYKTDEHKYLQWESVVGLENHEQLLCTNHNEVHKSEAEPHPGIIMLSVQNFTFTNFIIFPSNSTTVIYFMFCRCCGDPVSTNRGFCIVGACMHVLSAQTCKYMYYQHTYAYMYCQCIVSGGPWKSWTIPVHKRLYMYCWHMHVHVLSAHVCTCIVSRCMHLHILLVHTRMYYHCTSIHVHVLSLHSCVTLLKTYNLNDKHVNDEGSYRLIT